jgi:hypothetical protein
LSIGFIDHLAEEIPGSVAYLRFVHDSQDLRLISGGLLVVNSRGEPLEFVFGQVCRPPTMLRLFGDKEIKAFALLARGLFSNVKESPLILYTLKEELADSSFGGFLKLGIPLLTFSNVYNDQPITAAWGSEVHFTDGSAQAKIHGTLVEKKLLYEPFDRVRDGIAEAITKVV